MKYPKTDTNNTKIYLKIQWLRRRRPAAAAILRAKQAAIDRVTEMRA
jgi:hypothetical protein